MRIEHPKEVILKATEAGFEFVQTRGLQVKQPLKCIKHDSIFESYPHLLMGGRRNMACEDCAKEAIAQGTAAGISFWNRSSLIVHTLSEHGFFGHTFVGFDEATHSYLLRCPHTKRTFLSKSLLPEFRQGKTACTHCAQAVGERMRQRVMHANREHVNNTNPIYVWDNGARHCRIHGKLSQGRCYICVPRGESSVAKSRKVRSDRERLESKCRIEQALEQRKPGVLRALNKRLPNVRVASLEAVTNIVNCAHWRVATEGGTEFIFNSSRGEIVSDKTKPSSEIVKYIDHKKAFEMGARLTETQRLSTIHKLFRGEIEVLRIKQVCVADGQKGGRHETRLRLKHTCGHVWNTTYVKLIATKYGCQKCGRLKTNAAMSRAVTTFDPAKFLEETIPYMTYLSRFKLKAEPDAAYKYGYKVQCNRCNEVHKFHPVQLKLSKGCPSCSVGISGRGNRSAIANNWLGELSEIFGIAIKGHNSKEKVVRVRDATYRVDGFHEDSNTVFEFLGDYWHGNPKTFPSRVKEYRETMVRLLELGAKFNVVYVWESDYKESGLPHSGFIGLGPSALLA